MASIWSNSPSICPNGTVLEFISKRYVYLAHTFVHIRQGLYTFACVMLVSAGFFLSEGRTGKEYLLNE